MSDSQSGITLVVHGDPQQPSRTEALRRAAQEAVQRHRGSVTAIDGDGSGAPTRPALTLRIGARDAAHWLAVPEGPEAAPFEAAIQRFLADGGTHGDEGAPASRVDVFVAAACPNCPRAVDAALRVAAGDRTVTVVVVDAQELPEMAEAIPVRSVPTTVVDGGATFVGEVTADQLRQTLAGRGAPGQIEAVLRSLVEAGRLEAAGRWIAENDAGRPFAGMWREAAMESRIGLTLAAEHALEADMRALDPSVPALVELLDTPEAGRRGDTVDLLGRIAHPDARDALVLLRTDPDPDIAEAAAEAVDAIDARRDA